jgi:hypothetical protein
MLATLSPPFPGQVPPSQAAPSACCQPPALPSGGCEPDIQREGGTGGAYAEGVHVCHPTSESLTYCTQLL